MLLTEWKIEDALRVRGQEAREEGREEGKEKTLKELQELIKQGVAITDEILKKLRER